MTQPLDTRRLRELAEKATPGPWECEKWGDGSSGDVSVNVIAPSSESVLAADIMDFDARYIAEANPETIVALLDRLALAEQRLERARDAIERVLADSETGHWGPDVTMKGVLEQALSNICGEAEGE